MPPPAPASPPCQEPYITSTDPECAWGERDDRLCAIQTYINGHLKRFGMRPVPVDAVLGPETCGAAAWLMTEKDLQLPDTCSLESCEDLTFPEEAEKPGHTKGATALIAFTAIGLVALGVYAWRS